MELPKIEDGNLVHFASDMSRYVTSYVDRVISTSDTDFLNYIVPKIDNKVFIQKIPFKRYILLY